MWGVGSISGLFRTTGKLRYVTWITSGLDRAEIERTLERSREIARDVGGGLERSDG
jgi:hypothetical protein